MSEAQRFYKSKQDKKKNLNISDNLKLKFFFVKEGRI